MSDPGRLLRSAEVAALLERSCDALIAEWTRRVRSCPAFIAPARDLPEPWLVNHVPRLVLDLVAALRAGADSSASPADIGHTVWHGAHAEEHAEQRFRQGYALDELVREISAFRAAIVELLNRHDPRPDIDSLQLVHAAIDEAMAVAVGAFERAARETLEQSEAAYRRTVTSVADHAIFMIDVDGRVRTWNVGAERIMGYRADEVLGASFTIFYTPEERASELPARLLEQATNEGASKQAGWRLRKDGSTFFAETTLTALRDSSGALCGFSKVTRDVTERWRSEQELRKSRELMQALIDHSPTLVVVKDLAGRYLLTNRRFAEAFAHAGESLVGLDDAALIGEERARPLRERDAEVLRCECAVESEELAPDGTPFLVSRFPVRDAQQRVFGTAVIATDITERKRTERALATSEQRFRTLFAIAPIGIVALDAQTGAIERCNPRLCAITGYGEEELRGRTLAELAHPDDRDACAAAMNAVLHGHETTSDREGRLVRKDGRVVDVRQVLAAWRTDGDARAIAIALVEDIEARKTLERAREQATEQRERFVGIVSHDLRNPLGAILSATYLLERHGSLSGHDATLLARIHRSADSMRALIHDLLDYERARAGVAVPITPGLVELPGLLEEVVAETRQAHPQCKIDVAPCAPLRGEWDAARVQQAVTNLLVNAIQHGDPQEPVRIEASERDGHAVLAVWNAGAPIPAALRDTLFEPFKRAGRKGAGMGLGLFIVREIAVAHGGTVEVDSSAERGTTFRLVLPLA